MAAPLRPGDRIRLLAMPNDPFPIPTGSTGTVTNLTTGQFAQIDVAWDSGRSLCLIPGVDSYEIVARSYEVLRHQNGCPKCGNREFDGLGTDAKGAVTTCDKCGWKRENDETGDSGK